MYVLRGSDQKWLYRALRRYGGADGLERLAKHENGVRLLTAFETLIVESMLHRPKSGNGEWAEPDAANCAVAARVIVREVLRFAAHDPKRIASAECVRGDLKKLSDHLANATATLDEFSKRTDVWANKFLGRLNESEWSSLVAPKSNEALAKWTDDLQHIAATAAKMAAEYPKRESYINTRARLLTRRAAMLWQETTGYWPATSDNAAWPPALAEYRSTLVKDIDDEPPVLAILRAMSQTLDPKKAKLLRVKAFRIDVKDLRRDAEKRYQRPNRPSRKIARLKPIE